MAYIKGSTTLAARELLARDLASKEIFDVPILEHYLRSDSLPEAWVPQCRAHLSTLPAVKAAVRALKALQKHPLSEAFDAFDYNEHKQELRMYPYLVSSNLTIVYFINTSCSLHDVVKYPQRHRSIFRLLSYF